MQLKIYNSFFLEETNCVSVVFAYLLHYLNSRSKEIGFWHDGSRWVSMNYEEIAKALKISKKTVERAIHKLEDLGVILGMRGAHSRKSYTIDTVTLRELYPNHAHTYVLRYEARREKHKELEKTTSS